MVTDAQLKEIAQVIDNFYSSNSTHDTQTQKLFQDWQKDDTIAIPLAIHLMDLNSNYSTNCKYFGALTFTVQLNKFLKSNSESAVFLSDEGEFSNTLASNVTTETADFLVDCLTELMFQLCSYSITYLQDHKKNSNLIPVINKIISNLSVIFINVNKECLNLFFGGLVKTGKIGWKNPFNSFIVGCLILMNDQTQFLNKKEEYKNQIYSNLNGDDSNENLFEFLKVSIQSNKLILSFLNILMEEVIKNVESFRILPIQLSNIFLVIKESCHSSILTILNYNLQLRIDPGSKDELISSDDLLFQTLLSWVKYCQTIPNYMTEENDDAKSIGLGPLIFQVLQLMTADVVNFQYTNQCVNVFYHLMERDSINSGSGGSGGDRLLDYDVRCMIELHFNPDSPLHIINPEIPNNVDKTWILKYLQFLVENEVYGDDGLKKLSIFYVSLLENSITTLLKKVYVTETDKIDELHHAIQPNLEFLLNLTNFPLKPIIQETFSSQLTNFWFLVVEQYMSVPMEVQNNNLNFIIPFFTQLMNIYFSKLSLGTRFEIVKEYDNQEVLEFEDFRLQVIEFLDELWTIMGHQHMTFIILDRLVLVDPQTEFFELEVYILVLNGIFESMKFNKRASNMHVIKYLAKDNYTIINKVIEILKSSCQDVGNLSFIRTFTTFLKSIATFFQRKENHAILNHVVDFLLNIIFETPNLPFEIERLVISCLADICTTCKDRLTSYLSTFTKVLEMMLQVPGESNKSVSSNTRIKFNELFGAITSSIDSDSLIAEISNGGNGEQVFQHLALSQYQNIETYFNHVNMNLEKLNAIKTSIPVHVLQEYAISIIVSIENYIKGLGKGFNGQSGVDDDDDDDDDADNFEDSDSDPETANQNETMNETGLNSFSLSRAPMDIGNGAVNTDNILKDLNNISQPSLSGGSSSNGTSRRTGKIAGATQSIAAHVATVSPADLKKKSSKFIIKKNFNEFLNHFYDLVGDGNVTFAQKLSNNLYHIMNDTFNLINGDSNNLLFANSRFIEDWFSCINFIVSKNKIPILFSVENVVSLLENKLFNAYSRLDLVLPSLLSSIKNLIDQKDLIKNLNEFNFLYNNFILRDNLFENIIIKDPELLELYFNLLTTALDSNPGLIVPNNDDDLNLPNFISKIVPESFEILKSTNERFVITSIVKFLSKMINNKKFNQLQSNYINSIFINPHNLISYYNLLKILFMKILGSSTAEISTLSELIRLIMNKNKFEYKIWLENLLLKDADIMACCNNNTSIVSINTDLIQRIVATNGNKRVIMLINDWYLRCINLSS
ncbi:hypothetical protein QEN19_002408 [Hanseniaspora menglaensis]